MCTVAKNWCRVPQCVQSQSPAKNVTTKNYRFCLMDADANCQGGGVGSMRTRGVENRQNIADVFYGYPLLQSCNKGYIEIRGYTKDARSMMKV